MEAGFLANNLSIVTEPEAAALYYMTMLEGQVFKKATDSLSAMQVEAQ